MNNKLSILIFLTMLIYSCKEQAVLIPDFIPPESDRVVLIEELTGVKCVNCPQGAAKIKELLQLYEGQLVAIGIHGKVLSEPLEESIYDFRNEDAKAIEEYFAPIGKPAAAINRIGDFGEQTYLIPDTWGGAINNELLKDHKLNLELETEYDENTRELTINIGAIALAELAGDIRISVGITESHIIDAQLGSGGIMLEYEHNHVLRDMITNFRGDALTNSISKNEIINKSYTYTLPQDDNLWVAENCQVVAFVSRVLENSEEILQAAEAHVVK